MNLRHKVCALLLLALWLPYYAHCIEPHCHSAIVDGECCASGHEEDHGCDHHPDREHPWAECHSHDPATFAQGVLKLQPPAVLHVIATWLDVHMEPVFSQVPPLPPAIAGSGAAPPLQTMLVKTAQPTRGPAA